MSEDFDSLSKVWESQKGDLDFDLAKLKRRLLVKRVTLIVTTLLEMLIILALVLGIIVSPKYEIHWITIAWMAAALVISLMFTPALLKSRFRSYRLMNCGTEEWIKREMEHSEQVIYRCKLTDYFLVAFGAALSFFLGCLYVELDEPLWSILIRFVVSCAVLSAVYIFNRKVRFRHLSFLKNSSLS